MRHLEGQPLFAGLSKKERDFVAQHADEIDIPAGRELAHEGELAWEFFVIAAGSAEVRRGGETIATLGAGDFFGEMGVMSPDARRMASVFTTEPTKVIVMESHDLHAIANQMPSVAEQLRSAIAARSTALMVNAE